MTGEAGSGDSRTVTSANSDPDPIDYPIPSNDDAIRAIKLIAGKMADAVIEGRRLREVIAAEEGTEEVNQADMLDQYGSQDTIDRLKSGLDVAQTDA